MTLKGNASRVTVCDREAFSYEPEQAGGRVIAAIIAIAAACIFVTAIFDIRRSVAITACVTDHGHDNPSLLTCVCPCHRTTNKRAPIPRRTNL